jgi:hypothetical protein
MQGNIPRPMPTRMLLLLFWTTVCAAQTPAPICLAPSVSDWERDGLNGRVKVVRKFETWFRKETARLIRGKPTFEEEAKYDANGNRTYWHNPSLLPLDPNDEHIVEYECDGPTRIKEIRYRRKKDPSVKKTVWAYHDGIKTERADYFNSSNYLL